ncbi:hypothetical protein CCHR01_18266 [Colletotrichum chrysophilum]|uniref:Uncharacterized protein n=1 Tax=Colletotrichum chrysophilum TaxID=1836956 RepID=A0AAD9A0Z5_9PEZI|nr:hypothetical protein CCHR01_18266 [Colletotrichum chrysophilum]
MPHQVAPVAAVVVCTEWSLPSARGCPSRSNPPAVRSPCRLVVVLFQGSESGGCKCIALLRPPQRKRGNDGRPRFGSLFTTSAAGSRTDRCQGCPGFRSRHTSGSPVALSPWAGPSSAFLIDGPFIWGSICNLLTQDVSLFLPPARRLHQPHPATGTLSEPVDEGFAFQDHAGQRETGCASSPSLNLMVLSSVTLDTPSLWLLLAGCLLSLPIKAIGRHGAHSSFAGIIRSSSRSSSVMPRAATSQMLTGVSDAQPALNLGTWKSD